MDCECCKQRPVTIEETSDDGEVFSLCDQCRERLINYALRPLEFFNLFLRHGSTYYLHDDFYDEETGEAYQPNIDVDEPDKFPFPAFDEIKSDPVTLMSYALVKYSLDDDLVEEIRKLPKDDVLRFIDMAVRRHAFYRSSAYWIAAKTLGPFAEKWVRSEWESLEEGAPCFGIAAAMAGCLPFEEAFSLVSGRIEAGTDKYFQENSLALMAFQSERTLDWMENAAARIAPVTETWGRLAAMSGFNWERARAWLRKGRPLSLAALDALALCTAPASRLAGEAAVVRAHKPELPDAPDAKEVLSALKAYLAEDPVPRTENMVAKIRANMLK